MQMMFLQLGGCLIRAISWLMADETKVLSDICSSRVRRRPPAPTTGPRRQPGNSSGTRGVTPSHATATRPNAVLTPRAAWLPYCSLPRQAQLRPTLSATAAWTSPIRPYGAEAMILNTNCAGVHCLSISWVKYAVWLAGRKVFYWIGAHTLPCECQAAWFADV